MSTALFTTAAATSTTRRRFLKQSAAGTAGLVFGVYVPMLNQQALAQGAATVTAAAPEVNAWVVVQPDDKVVIRIARSEMGQGTLTGLAQMVAEELQCDWANVSTMYPTPGLTTFTNFGETPIRGRYERGDLIYVVHKNTLYSIANDGTQTVRGTLVTYEGKVFFALTAPRSGQASEGRSRGRYPRGSNPNGCFRAGSGAAGSLRGRSGGGGAWQDQRTRVGPGRPRTAGLYNSTRRGDPGRKETA